LAGGGAPKMTLMPTTVGLLLQVNIKGRWYKAVDVKIECPKLEQHL
jgi:hypothetical protein